MQDALIKAVRALISFARSFAPADRAFPYLLLGSASLYISASLGWWPAWHTAALRSLDWIPTQHDLSWNVSAQYLFLLLSVPFRVAGATGFLTCFFPGDRPLRRLFRWVYWPAGIGVVATSLTILFAASRLTYIPIPARNGSPWNFFRYSSVSWNPGPGPLFAAAGLILIAAAAYRIHRGYATLPIHLRPSEGVVTVEQAGSDEDREWMRFVWIMTALVPLATAAGAIPSTALFLTVPLGSSSEVPLPFWVFELSISIGSALGVFGLLLLAIGRKWKPIFRHSLRLPSTVYFGLGILIPAAIFSAVPILSFVRDRIHWAAFDFGRFHAPFISGYFPMPELISARFFLPALLEEIAWRGYLQPRLISRYGLYRGIFLVGIVWGAFHFSGDFNWTQTTITLLLNLAIRLTSTVAWGFVLSWLTLRSGSVIPAAVAHTTLNVIVFSKQPYPTPWWLAPVFWGLVGFLLFRFWPPREPQAISQEFIEQPL